MFPISFTHRKTKFIGINRQVERPCKLVLPQCLDNYILHVLQLVSLAARFGRVGHLRGSRDDDRRSFWGCWSDRWHFGKKGKNCLTGKRSLLLCAGRLIFDSQCAFSLCFSVIWEGSHPIAGPDLWPKNKKYDISNTASCNCIKNHFRSQNEEKAGRLCVPYALRFIQVKHIRKSQAYPQVVVN